MKKSTIIFNFFNKKFWNYLKVNISSATLPTTDVEETFDVSIEENPDESVDENLNTSIEENLDIPIEENSILVTLCPASVLVNTI